MLCEGEKYVDVIVKNPTNEYKILKKGYKFGIAIESSQTLKETECDELKYNIRKVETVYQKDQKENN